MPLSAPEINEDKNIHFHHFLDHSQFPADNSIYLGNDAVTSKVIGVTFNKMCPNSETVVNINIRSGS